jgi:hypothetical protein
MEYRQLNPTRGRSDTEAEMVAVQVSYLNFSLQPYAAKCFFRHCMKTFFHLQT